MVVHDGVLRFVDACKFDSRSLMTAVCLVGLLSCSAEVRSETWATKMFATTHHDFGSVGRNAKTEFAFVIENIYEEEVHIAAIRSSCGCTQPVLEKRSLKTWEKADLVAKFNTRSFIGSKNAVITVVIDRPFYAEVQLTVQGHIRSDIVVEPGEVRFGEVPVGTAREIPVRISYAGRPDWEVTDVRGNSEHLSVRMSPSQRSGNTTTYMMHVSVLPTAPVGELMDELSVITNDPQDNAFSLSTLAKIIPPVSITPSQIVLGNIVSGQVKADRFVVKGNKPFRITAIECEDKRFEFKMPTEARPVHVVPFAFKGETDSVSPNVKQAVRIRTDLGEEIVAECLVTGQVIR